MQLTGCKLPAQMGAPTSTASIMQRYTAMQGQDRTEQPGMNGMAIPAQQKVMIGES